MIQIPLQAIPAQEIQIILDNQECTIKFYWRFGRLFCDLYVADTLVVGGAICQNLASIVQVTQTVFTGSLHFFDLLGDTPPEWDGLNSRYVLLYVSADEELPLALRF